MTISPMFVQYHELKAADPDAILFFRLGDFYEIFFVDAVLAARELELTLTSRNKNDDEPIPMAGVPHHAAAGYIQRLAENGHRVAIAEQVEDPALAKGLVRRAIVRVVTPGVAFDPSALDGRQPSWLVGIHKGNGAFGLAFLDVTTGDLIVTHVADEAAAVSEIHRMEPKEALLQPDSDWPVIREGLRRHRTVLSRVEESAWELRDALREIYDTTKVDDLGVFGVERTHAALPAVGALLRYGRDTTGGPLRNVHKIRPYQTVGFMVLDDASRRNLELSRTLLGGQKKGSLLHLLDRTSTVMGARMLREWLAFPLLDPDAIGVRQRAVAGLVNEPETRESLGKSLCQVADIERIGARVAQGTAHARDLGHLRRSLLATPGAVAALHPLKALQPFLPPDLAEDVANDLAFWLVDEPPLTLDEGGVIRPGADAELDRLTELSVKGMALIAELEERERAASGIASLKIRRNSVFGYFIEITRAQAHKVPDRYLRKQTLTTGERFITPELKELEEQVLGADERRVAVEHRLFVALRERISAASARLLALARHLATLDALASLADVAERYRWARPEVNSSTELTIQGGRHPVVEALLTDSSFVPNDTQLDADLTAGPRLVVLTGPNMAGKSTFLRQTALIVLLAQIGSFVPVEQAKIGVCDRIFTRVGAVDDLGRGQSTFMVEMAETATILHHATARSLVILDEIGRGTSTYDGLSIAWAVADDLATRIRCRALFATHYHELCELAETREGVVNQSVAVHETGDRIVFLHRLKNGGASRSYGIQCARLAGLPAHVVEKAKTMLKEFERHAPKNAKHQLSLFGAGPAEPASVEPVIDPLRRALAELEPDALSPRQAHDALYALVRLL